MSIATKALVSAATVLAGTELRRFLSTLDVEDFLEPLGLTRRRSHVGQSILLLGAGALIGGAAFAVLASGRRAEIVSWLTDTDREDESYGADEDGATSRTNDVRAAEGNSGASRSAVAADA